ncbi:hypothetical protein A3K88_22900 [Pseudomonas putida]|nr:hypothetical protein A3K88_22900 [Pseudomonas putida]
MCNEVSLSLDKLLSKTRSLSRHEAAHFIITYAQGLESNGISLDIGLEAHRGKSYSVGVTRCESLDELQQFTKRRISVLLAGAMGEALDPSTLEVDPQSAFKILEEGDTGAGQDYAIARELINLLYNSMPIRVHPQTDKPVTSRDLLCNFLEAAWTLVQLNANAICKLAEALELGVIANSGKYEVRNSDIDTLELYNLIPTHLRNSK